MTGYTFMSEMKLSEEFISAELDRWTRSDEIYPIWIEGNNWSHKLVVMFAAHIARILEAQSDV
jgi:hypothetical protein